MAIFETYSDVSSKTMISTVGESITVFSDEEGYVIRGIYEDSYFSNFQGEVPVLLETPSFIIRDREIAQFTPEYPLSRTKWKIRRNKDGCEYIILDYERDEISTVRYTVELDRNQKNDQTKS